MEITLDQAQYEQLFGSIAPEKRVTSSFYADKGITSFFHDGVHYLLRKSE